MVSSGWSTLATLTRSVCPCVMPTMPKKKRSGTGGDTSDCARARPLSRTLANAARAATAMIVTSVRFLNMMLFASLTLDRVR